MRRVLVGTAIAVIVLAMATAAAAAVLSKRVTGPSMRPTLQDGDRVVVNPFVGTPRRFELVTVRFTDGGPLAIKRVIGLPGDRVRIEAGRVDVQPGGTGPWLRVDNPAWRDRWHRATPRAETTVPDDALFVLGDNPDASDDSRTLGPSPLRLLGGTVWQRTYPPGRIPNDVRLQPFETDR